jgi:uncharacterized protein (TIGR03000 family)
MSRSTFLSIKVAALAIAVVLLTTGESQAQRWIYWPGGLGNPWGGGYAPYGNYGTSYYPYGGGYSSPSYYYTMPSTSSTWYSQQSNYYMVPVAAYSSAPTYTQNPNEKAAIEVQVPATAQVWFDGTQTSQKGADRYFATPPLPRGKSYVYEVRATWTDASGAAVSLTREVTVQAGKWSVVNFLDKSAP